VPLFFVVEHVERVQQITQSKLKPKGIIDSYEGEPKGINLKVNLVLGSRAPFCFIGRYPLAGLSSTTVGAIISHDSE